MYIEKDPFPLLKIGQYADNGDGSIIFLDKTIPEDKKHMLEKEYRVWWEKRQKEKEVSGFE